MRTRNIFPEEDIFSAPRKTKVEEDRKSKVREYGKVTYTIPFLGEEGAVGKSAKQRPYKDFTTSLRIPAPRAKYRQGKEYSYETSVLTWLGKVGYQALYFTKVYDQSELRECLNRVAESKLSRYILSDDDFPRKGYGIEREKLSSTVDQAARWALATYKLDYHTVQAVRGAEGGRKSSRGPSYPPELLKTVEGLSAREAGLKLGCTDRTIRNMRAAARAEELRKNPFADLLEDS
jgi:hypothetical protein